MARIVPDGWQIRDLAGPPQRRVETLERLARALPDACTVYHGVHWTRLQDGQSLYGEIDFAVVAANGRVMRIKRKNGLRE